MAIEHNIKLEDAWFAGADMILDYDIVQGDGSTPQEMTGWSLAFDLKAKPEDATPLVTKTTGAGITIMNGLGTNSKARVTVNAADTTALASGTYYHQLWRTNAGNNKPLSFGPAPIRNGGR